MVKKYVVENLGLKLGVEKSRVEMSGNHYYLVLLSGKPDLC